MNRQDVKQYPDEMRRGQREAAHEAHGQSTAEIRREIERTRGQIDRTVDRLEFALSPSRLLDSCVGWAEDAFRRTPREADGGGGKRPDLATRCGRIAADHPVPMALVAAGIGWLVVDSLIGRGEQRKGSDLSESDAMVPASTYEQTRPPQRPTARQTEGARPSHMEAAGPVTGERPVGERSVGERPAGERTAEPAAWSAGSEDGRH